MFDDIVKFIRDQFNTDAFIPLHEPRFYGNEKRYLNQCIDSTFVSSVGEFVDQFEEKMAEYCDAQKAVAVVNGTAALHIGLQLVGVERNHEVITQALTFIATCNAISYIGAHPVFIDVDRKTLGMSAQALSDFLEQHTEMIDDQCINKSTRRKIAAVVPMHTFGNPCEIEKIVDICKKHHIAVVEDAAESLGSFVNYQHTGLLGDVGVLSFNGNKTITTGGGGMIITQNQELAQRAKYLTTTAKQAHPYRFIHTEIGYNYRLPNLNAALGCAQLENLPAMIKDKTQLAESYAQFFDALGLEMVKPVGLVQSNHWLNAIILDNKSEQEAFLKLSNEQGVMTRPVWEIMPSLPMFQHCQTDDLTNTLWLADRVVNIPSSCRL